MGTSREPEALLQVARLYYVENLSQQQVAARLGVSRSNVSRMLSDALAQGIVEIRINDPARRERALERDLEQAFGLRAARVAEHAGAFGSTTRVTDQLGVLASQLLVSSLTDQMTIGLSWGQALHAMVRATSTEHTPSLQVVALAGGLSSAPDEANGPELVRELASRVGASYRSLLAPVALTNSTAAQVLLREQPVAAALASARAADIAFVGIGTPTDGSSPGILASLDLTRRQTTEFWRQRPVGQVAARYFDSDGRALTGAVHDRVLAVTLDELAAIPTVVVIASGRAKVAAMLGALAGGLVDVLVCDENLARGVLTETA